MKHNKMTFKISLFLLGCVLAFLTATTARAEANDYALLIQSSPPDAGIITPGAGVHQIQIGQTVALAAKPKKGYRFMYWLGDVSKTSGINTTVSIDSPKLVVAVFSREDFEGELPSSGIIDGQFAGGGGGRFNNPVQSPGSVSPASGRFDADFPTFEFADMPVFPPVIPDIPVDDDINDIPVPGEDDDDIPVPGDGEVPEPATVVLLGIGGFMALRKKRN